MILGFTKVNKRLIEFYNLFFVHNYLLYLKKTIHRFSIPIDQTLVTIYHTQRFLPYHFISIIRASACTIKESNKFQK